MRRSPDLLRDPEGSASELGEVLAHVVASAIREALRDPTVIQAVAREVAKARAYRESSAPPLSTGEGFPVRLAYTIKEAALVSGVGRTTLYKAIRSGDLKIMHVGRRTLVSFDALRRWLDECSSRDLV